MPIRHIANSGAVMQLPESYLDMVRPGILMYGVYPANDIPRTMRVEPVLSWKSRVVYFKVLKPGHPVSYGHTWQSDHLVRIVTIPVGYGDGYFRSTAGKAQVILRGLKYPVVTSCLFNYLPFNVFNRKGFFCGTEIEFLNSINGRIS